MAGRGEHEILNLLSIFANQAVKQIVGCAGNTEDNGYVYGVDPFYLAIILGAIIIEV